MKIIAVSALILCSTAYSEGGVVPEIDDVSFYGNGCNLGKDFKVELDGERQGKTHNGGIYWLYITENESEPFLKSQFYEETKNEPDLTLIQKQCYFRFSIRSNKENEKISLETTQDFIHSVIWDQKAINYGKTMGHVSFVIEEIGGKKRFSTITDRVEIPTARPQQFKIEKALQPTSLFKTKCASKLYLQIKLAITHEVLPPRSKDRDKYSESTLEIPELHPLIVKIKGGKNCNG